jgi:hypothetical protein
MTRDRLIELLQRQGQARSGRSSQYLGVSFKKARRKWVSQLAGKHAGCHDDEIEAAHAYDGAVVQSFRLKAKTNFPLTDYLDLLGAYTMHPLCMIIQACTSL